MCINFPATSSREYLKFHLCVHGRKRDQSYDKCKTNAMYEAGGYEEEEMRLLAIAHYPSIHFKTHFLFKWLSDVLYSAGDTSET